MPAEGQEQLLAIRATARDAMDELRRVLGVLRDDADAEAAEHQPQPGLDRLDELLGSAREAGTPVRLILQGHAESLAAGVDLAAYRIVQEALTNARRHAPGAAVDAELRYGHPAMSHPGPSATTGPGENGGFVVEAELPRRMSIRVVVADDQEIVRAALRRPACHATGRRGRGHRRRRRRGGPGVRAAAAGCRADGRAHAGRRRHRGDAAPDRRCARDHPHHLRPRRLRLRRAQRRGERVPARGRAAPSGCSTRCAWSPPARRCSRRA